MFFEATWILSLVQTVTIRPAGNNFAFQMSFVFLDHAPKGTYEGVADLLACRPNIAIPCIVVQILYGATNRKFSIVEILQHLGV